MARNKDFFVNSTPKRDKSFFVKETAPTSAVSLQNSTANKSVKPTNPSDLLKRVTVVDNRKLSTALRANELENQIKQKESEYVKAANMSDWSQSIKERERISKELSAMQDELKSKRAELRDSSQDKLLTAQQAKENQKNAPLTQKIDKAIKNDIPKTVEKVGRTAADLVGSGLAGATNAVEGIADFAVGNVGAVASGVTSGFGLAPNSLSEKIKKGAEDFTRINFSGEDILEEKKKEGTGIYEPKILGIKVRDAINTISNMITSAAVGGVPGFITSAAGQGIEEALLDNQSLNRAVVYGDISGAIEGLTEKMFDAVKLLGGGKFDKFLPKGAIGKLIGGSAGEAFEEVIADGVNPFLKYLTYEKGTYDMPTLAEYLNTLKESAWNGFVIGLIMKGGQDVTSPQIREQYKQEITNAVEKAKGLNQQQKEIVKQELSKIPEQGDLSLLALPAGNENMAYANNGNIRLGDGKTPTIDNNLTYDVVNGRQALVMPDAAENVLRESPQKAELQQPNVTLPTQTEMAQKANMNQIRGNTKLMTRRAETTLQSAKIAGANDINMNKAIELNDLLRSGAEVKFYNPQNIPQGVDANKAKVANGFYSNGTVWINKNTKNAVEVVLGHELTHHLETTDSYTDLANTILDSDVFYDYIAEKGYSNVAEYKQSLGQNYTAEQFDSEMVANFVQDKLFSDQNSIDRLARQNTTLVEKIKNWISDLVVTFKGTAQEKELRRIEGMYRKALEQARNTTASTDTQYSIAGVKAMENIGDRELTQSYKEAQRTGQNTRGWFKDKEGNWKFEFSDKDMTLKKNLNLSDTGNRLGDILEHDTLFRAYPELADMIVNFKDIEDASGFFHKGTGEITLNKKLFKTKEWKKNVEASLIHEIQHAIQEIEGYPGAANPFWSKKAYYEALGEIEASDTKERFLKEQGGVLDRNITKPRSSEPNPKHRKYDEYMSKRGIVDKIKDAAFPYYAGKGGKGYEILEEDVVENNKSDLRMDDSRGLRGYVKDTAGKEPAFSMPETDNQGRKLSKEQQEFFKDSKVRDEDGKLLEVYHGTNADEFTIFDKELSDEDNVLGQGLYFTADKEQGKKYGTKIYSTYLNIKNPFAIDDLSTYSLANKIKELDFNADIIDYDYGVASTEKMTDYLIENGYDGIKAGADVYVAFEPNQIKNVDNTNPTSNPDIRYSMNPVDVAKNPPNSQNDLLEEIAPIDEKKLDDVEEKERVASIFTRSPKRPAKDLLKQSVDVFMRKLVDAGNTINTVGKLTGDKHLYEYFNNTKQARQSAEYMIGEAQTDIRGNRVGNSLIRIFESVRAKGDDYTNKFFEYLLHMHNIDRMAQNKPVFGKSVTAEDSSRYVKELLEKYPEFEKQANKVYAYNRNLMQWRVDSGLISQEQADLMNQMYPHYVPTFRDVSGTSGSRAMQGTVQIANTVRKATGSDKDIMPIDASMARQTMQTVQAAKRNLLGNRLLNDVLNNKDKVGEYVQAVEKVNEQNDVETEMESPKDTNLEDNNNVFKIFRNGETYVMKVNNGIYEGLKSISSEIDNTDTNLLLKPVKAANNAFKKLITGYSPMFTLKNFSRDIQDAGFYSKELKGFLKKYPNTYQEMMGNGKMWQLYKSLGGTGSSVFDYETGIEKELDSRNKASTKIKEATVGKVEELNMMIEQAPRFAEFMATIEKAGNKNYDTLMEAMLNAADITVNFGRSGTWGKALNSTFVPFFNPSIQGFDKSARTILESNTGKKFAKLAIRATLLGILPSVINELLYWDDDEYENLTDRDKDTNFLIKVGDNKWLKIPKGRVLSIFGNTATRGLRTLKGEKWDLSEYAKNQVSQTAPISVFDSNLYSPIQAVQNNKTWYGSDIVPQRLQDYAPKEQYDENTDAFSKWLGGKINYSPKKINYLIDAYTGIIGDVVLPLMTPKAETNPFTKAFVLDGVSSNEISNDFYDMMDKYNTKQNPKKSAKEVSRYLNKQSKQVSDIFKQVREVENSDLSDAEKRKQVRELRELANTIELTTMAIVPEYEKAVDKYRGTFADEDVDSEYAYLYANRDIFGAEYAVKTFSKALYNNHKDENMETFFSSYFTREYFQKKLEPEKKSTNTLPTKATQSNKLKPLGTLPTQAQQKAKLKSLKN